MSHPVDTNHSMMSSYMNPLPPYEPNPVSSSVSTIRIPTTIRPELPTFSTTWLKAASIASSANKLLLRIEGRSNGFQPYVKRARHHPGNASHEAGPNSSSSTLNPSIPFESPPSTPHGFCADLNQRLAPTNESSAVHEQAGDPKGQKQKPIRSRHRTYSYNTPVWPVGAVFKEPSHPERGVTMCAVSSCQQKIDPNPKAAYWLPDAKNNRVLTPEGRPVKICPFHAVYFKARLHPIIPIPAEDSPEFARGQQKNRRNTCSLPNCANNIGRTRVGRLYPCETHWRIYCIQQKYPHLNLHNQTHTYPIHAEATSSSSSFSNSSIFSNDNPPFHSHNSAHAVDQENGDPARLADSSIRGSHPIDLYATPLWPAGRVFKNESDPQRGTTTCGVDSCERNMPADQKSLMHDEKNEKVLTENGEPVAICNTHYKYFQARLSPMIMPIQKGSSDYRLGQQKNEQGLCCFKACPNKSGRYRVGELHPCKSHYETFLKQRKNPHLNRPPGYQGL